MQSETLTLHLQSLVPDSISAVTRQRIADGLSGLRLLDVGNRFGTSQLQTQAQMHRKRSLLAGLDSPLHPAANYFGKLMRRKALCHRQFGGRYLQLKARRNRFKNALHLCHHGIVSELAQRERVKISRTTRSVSAQSRTASMGNAMMLLMVYRNTRTITTSKAKVVSKINPSTKGG
jgi:hypothetical protein